MPQPDRDADPGAELDFMRRIASGDASAFRRLVETHHPLVLGLGLRFLGDRGEAEDLCQEVFLLALRKAASFQGTGSLRGWLCRIASNLACDRRRRPRLAPIDLPVDPAVPAADPASVLERGEIAEAVRNAVASLPERQRIAVILLRYEGFTYREIAEVLECRLPAVESLIHRAHVALREKLKKFAE